MAGSVRATRGMAANSPRRRAAGNPPAGNQGEVPAPADATGTGTGIAGTGTGAGVPVGCPPPPTNAAGDGVLTSMFLGIKTLKLSSISHLR